MDELSIIKREVNRLGDLLCDQSKPYAEIKKYFPWWLALIRRWKVLDYQQTNTVEWCIINGVNMKRTYTIKAIDNGYLITHEYWDTDWFTEQFAYADWMEVLTWMQANPIKK